MSLCIAAGGKLLALAATSFTLSWTHSVEKTRWEEAWALTEAGLVLTAARVEGSGAGMEPGDDAVFDGRGWSWTPRLPPQERLVLGDSGKAGTWRFCAAEACRVLGGSGAGPVAIAACPD